MHAIKRPTFSMWQCLFVIAVTVEAVVEYVNYCWWGSLVLNLSLLAIMSIGVLWSMHRAMATIRNYDTQKELNNRLLRQSFDNTNGGVWEWDIRSGRDSMSDGWANMLGYSADEIEHVYSFWSSKIHPDDKDKVMSALNATIEGKTPIYSVEYRIRHKNGTYIDVIDNGIITEWDNRGPIKMVGTNRSMPLLSQEDKLKEAISKIAMFQSLVKIGTWMWEEKNGLVYWDDMSYNLLGYSKDEHPPPVSDDLFFSRVHPDDEAAVQDFVTRLSNGSTASCKYRAVVDGNIIHLESLGNIAVSNADHGNVMFGVTIDRTSDELTIEELANQKEMLVEKNKELENFMFFATHDLQEPLRKIMFYGNRISTDPDASQLIINKASSITNAGARLQDLIDDLLRFFRVGTDHAFADVDLNNVIGSVHANMSNSISQSRAVIVITNELPHVYGIEQLLNMLFQNLISNSIKYQEENNQPYITISSEDHVSHYNIIYTDNGIGIPEEYKFKIFEPFKRLHPKSKYPGNGIGLSICNKIIEKHNGKIWLHSSCPGHSKFIIQIPKRGSDGQCEANDSLHDRRRP